METIQPEQYEQIAASQKPVLIVQGAAGSGKSLVGLHRIDFILSAFSNIGNLTRPIADHVVLFGPSPAFLQHISKLLPGLGVHRVRQMTATDWLLEQFSSRVTLSSRDTVLDDLMNNRRKLTEAEVEAHLFKGSMQMKSMLDNFVSDLRKWVERQPKRSSGLTISGLHRQPLEIRVTDLNNRVREALAARSEPNAAREHLIAGLVRQWMITAPGRNPAQGPEANEARREARRLVTRAVGNIWPRTDFRASYTALLSDPQEILRHAKKGT